MFHKYVKLLLPQGSSAYFEMGIHHHQPKSSKDQLKHGLEDKLPTAIWRGRWRESTVSGNGLEDSFPILEFGPEVSIISCIICIYIYMHAYIYVCVCVFLFIVSSLILHVNKCRPRRIQQFELSPLCGCLEHDMVVSDYALDGGARESLVGPEHTDKDPRRNVFGQCWTIIVPVGSGVSVVFLA